MDGLRNRFTRIAAGIGIAVGVALGVTALASAATTQAGDDTTTTQPPATTAPAPAPTPAPAPDAPAAPGAPAPGPGGRAMKGHGPGGFGFPGGGIHGEFTVPAPNGGYQTLATQMGEVTKVSSSSITVKSEDGYERTYAVDEGTVVTSGRDGIANVKTGDKVHVLATVANGNAKAVRIGDMTQVESRSGAWAPKRNAAAPDGTA